MRVGPLLLLIATGVSLTGCDLFVSAETRIERAETALADGNHRLAAIELRNVLENMPDHVRGRQLLAEASLWAGDAETAEKEIRRAIELGLPAAEAGVLVSRIQLAMGRADALITQIETGEVTLAEPARSLYLGQALHATGRLGEADAAYRAALLQDPALVDARIGLAQLRAREGDSTAAVADLQALTGEQPEAARAWMVLGDMLARRGQFVEAEAALLRAREHAGARLLDPERIGVQSGIVEARLAQNNVEAARAALSELVRFAPNSIPARFLTGRLALESGDAVTAVAEFQRVVNAVPAHVPARMSLAGAQVQQGNLQQAEINLADAVRRAPDNMEARKMLAQVRLRLGRPDAAVQALTPALATGASDPQLLALLSTANLQAGNEAAAIALLEQSVRANPDDVSLRLNLANAYIAAGRHANAINLLRAMPENSGGLQRETLLVTALAASRGPQAARQEIEGLVGKYPDDLGVLNLAAAYAVSQRAFDQARRYLDLALRRAPADAQTLINLARLESAAGEVGAARQALEKVAAADPANSTALLWLAQLAGNAGESGEAVRWLEQLRERSPDSVEARLMLARFRLAENDAAGAATLLDEAVDVAGPDVEALNQGGTLLLEFGRYDEALARFRRATEVSPDHPDSWLNMSRAQSALDQPDAARESLTRAVGLRPDWVQAESALALLELRSGNTAAAIARARALQTRNPQDADPVVLEGDLQMAASQFGEAVRTYNRAAAIRLDRSVVVKSYRARRAAGDGRPEEPLQQWLARQPGDARIRGLLAEAHQIAGRRTEAVAEFERALAINPGDALILNNLAWMYYEVRDERAEPTARRAYELARVNPLVADTYGWILVELGRVDEGLPILRTAAAAAENQPEIQYHYAAALARAGRQGEARQVLEKVLAASRSFASREAAEALMAELRQGPT